ncbi:histidine phosphatase superfamily (branch 2) domain-containing protein [Ditylenchus destructor]|uniref:Histidine phosphatase superfamily (Branch 2) domain-containing protein n=1 Tax=Ditylenchus destructor TaxID=166010 RepID=A0AAD4N8E8_9BILA|nr:histidine phosphatase superfamily (branch 2) domain-containing protein [Ditylenchus destructor]
MRVWSGDIFRVYRFYSGLLLFLAFSYSAQAAERRLKYVHAIWRHGDRAPKAKPYLNDKYDASYWRRGWSQLTNLGMVQMRELGAYFRSQYADNFVNPVYQRDEVIIKSSNADRALVSAQAFANGFFPPTKDFEFFDPTLNWQPIAIHSTGTDESDPMLKPTGFKCPAYKTIKIKAADALEAELMPKYAEFVEFLKPIVQPNLESPPKIRLRDITKLIDIEREIVHNLTQPDWVFKRWPQYAGKSTIDIILELRHLERNAEFNETSLSYLMGGLLLGDWLDRLQAVARGEPIKPSKMMLYSAHDGTLNALLYSLMTVWDGFKVPYASCVIMELYEVGDKYVVELFYRRNGLNEHLTIKGCIQSCPLDRFINLLRANAIYKTETLYKACGLATCMTGSGSFASRISMSPYLFAFVIVYILSRLKLSR